MTARWADELPGSEPDPKLETFYLLVSMKLGDPRKRDWIVEHAHEFYKMYANWAQYGTDSTSVKRDKATVMVQYLLWYERDGPPEQVDNNSTRGT